MKAMRQGSNPREVLRAMAEGWTLKAHRDIEGRKEFWLHPLEGEAEAVDGEVAAGLVAQGLIDSNKKFPAATFWLTEAGRQSLGRSPAADE